MAIGPARRTAAHVTAAAAMLVASLSIPGAAAAPPVAPRPTGTPVHVAAGKLTNGVDIALRPTAFGSISGRVVERGSGQPVRSLQVAAYSRSDRLIRRAYTDKTGTYALRLPASRHGYAICFRDSHKVPRAHGATSTTGWAPECYPHQPWSASHTSLPAGATRVPVGKGQETKHVGARIRPGGAISGRVTQHGRKVGVRADVYLRSVGAPHYMHAFSSDGFGRYRVDGLPAAAGGYQVCFDPSEANGSPPGYLPRCYGTNHWLGFPKEVGDSSTEFSPPRFPGGATHVRVRLGSVRTGVGAPVRVGGAISGRIVDRATGARVGDPGVKVYDRRGHLVAKSFASEGRFTVTSVPPGAAYYVCAFPLRYVPDFLGPRPDSYQRGCYRDTPWTGPGSRTSGMSVGVERGKTRKNVVIALRRASTIQGTVTSAADGQPVTGRVYLFSGAGTLLDSEVNEDFDHPGEYLFMGVPASRSGYVVCASAIVRHRLTKPWLRPACYSHARWDGASGAPPANAHRIPIGADVHRRRVDIALHPGGAISGHVAYSAPGSPFHIPFVYVVDGRGRHVAKTQVHVDGTWSFAGLDPARSYRICAANGPRALFYEPTCHPDVLWYRR